MKQDEKEMLEVAKTEKEAMVSAMDDLQLVLVGGGSGEVVFA
jgi:hypothetical protein